MANHIERKIAGVALAASLIAAGCSNGDAKTSVAPNTPSSSPIGMLETPRPSMAAGSPDLAIQLLLLANNPEHSLIFLEERQTNGGLINFQTDPLFLALGFWLTEEHLIPNFQE